MIVKSFDEAGIKLPRGRREGTIKVLCPQCSHRRVKSDEPCLSISFNKPSDNGGVCHLGYCHHCKAIYQVFENGLPNREKFEYKPQEKKYKVPTWNYDEYELNQETVEWFENRGITQDILDLYQIRSCEKSFGKDKPAEDAIMFPMMKGHKLVNVQYRNLGDSKTKRYKTIFDAQLVLFGFNNVVIDGSVATDTIIITEGYIDALSAAQAGYVFSMSVPNGTPFEEAGKMPVKSPRLEYLDDPDAQWIFSQVKKVIIAGDDDHQGRRLVEELASRVGMEKCYRVRYPDGCKDLNDVLRKYGKENVEEVIEGAVRMPVAGIVTVAQCRDEVRSKYQTGPDVGLSTGFGNLDRIARIGTGRMWIITGVPESGKSRLSFNLAINIAKLHGARTSLFTPESRPYSTCISKLLQIYNGKPFHGLNKMDEEELNAGLDWLDNYITFNNAEERTLKAITDTWKYQLMSEGIHYGVLDPFNYLVRPGNASEIDFILATLTFISNFCVTNNFTAFIVAHPTKVMTNRKSGEYPVIDPYNIAGSANHFNASDTIVSIWRSRFIHDAPVQIHVKKMKQEELGTSNKLALFHYDTSTGIYTPYGENPDEIYKPSGVDEDGCPAYEPDDSDYEKDALLSRETSRYNQGDDETDKPLRRRRS